MSARWRIGIDVGGTFTDLVAISSEGRFVREKIASTPSNPAEGLLASLRSIAGRVALSDIAYIGHASTIATNALLGQANLELPPVVFVTTEGFRDVVEIGRQNRSSVYDLNVRRPRPLAARADRITVRERIAYDGSVLVALSDDEIAAVVEALRTRGCSTIAIGLLNSHRNDAHERALAAAIRVALPDVAVTSSAELVREEREYERFSTAIVNAALVPIVGRYLEGVARGLAELGVSAPAYVMQSSGGTASLEAAARRPAAIIESGPAAGVIAAAALGRRLGIHDVLSFDMGGTTAKAGTIVNAAPEIAHEFEAAGATHSGRARKGSGYPVLFPFVDLAEISAGGGTIARVDAAGILRIGPLSAGADPGPACYGRAMQPTVTDANVVLGRLNPVALAGGSFPIDAARSYAAIATVAEPLDGDIAKTAAGIVALVDANMAKVLRIVSVERGLDPRSFALMAFGGGGPLHACALAADLGIARVIVPEHPGLFSALGLLAAKADASRSRSMIATLTAKALDRARSIADDLERDTASILAAQGIGETDVSRELDVRYLGQSFDLAVPFDDRALDCEAIANAFHRMHEKRYGFSATDEAIEIATVRVTARALADASGGFAIPAGTIASTAGAARIGERLVWDCGEFVSAKIFAREHLSIGERIHGPAVIEQYDSTTWLPLGWTARNDASRQLFLEPTADLERTADLENARPQ